jgi:hypothetical protein
MYLFSSTRSESAKTSGTIITSWSLPKVHLSTSTQIKFSDDPLKIILEDDQVVLSIIDEIKKQDIIDIKIWIREKKRRMRGH